MNRYDKEERIINDFQDLKITEIGMYPLNFKILKLYRCIHNKRKWTKWLDTSAKNELPPDFYNDNLKLMMDVMRIDDHAYIDEDEPLEQKATYLQKCLQNKGFTENSKSFFLQKFNEIYINC